MSYFLCPTKIIQIKKKFQSNLFSGAAFNDNRRPPDRNNIDAEYMSLMAELGEGPPPAPPRGGGGGPMAPSAGGGRSNAAPQPLMGPSSGGGRGLNSWDRGGPPGPPPPRGGGGGPQGPPPNNSWNTGPRGLIYTLTQPV